MYVKGVDISVWQNIRSTPQMFDPVKARAQGVRFVGIKASQATWADPDFIQNWKNCQPWLYRMPYHFLTWNVGAKAQAETFWSLLEKNHWGTLPFMVDFEWWQTTPTRAIDYLSGFLERLKQLAAPLPLGIYTAKSFWDVYGSRDASWTQYALWQCWINAGEPPPVAPWNKWDFWQFTFKLDGLLHGAESKDLDGDYFNGSLAEMRQKYALPELENPFAAESGEAKAKPTAYVVVPVLNIRREPNTTSRITGQLNLGAKVEIADIVASGDVWVMRPDGTYVAFDVAGKRYLDVGS